MLRVICLLTIAVVTGSLFPTVADSETEVAGQSLVDAPVPRATPRVWPDGAPADCPLPRSSRFSRVQFTGRHREYTHADTWYPSWASDGNLYSPWTDGSIGKERCGSGSGAKARTGQAKIIGDDGKTMWLCYSANWSRRGVSGNPPGSRYALCLQEIRLLTLDEARRDKPTASRSTLDAPENVARRASVTASSHYPDCPPQGAVNGIVGGLDLTEFGDEWSAQNEHAGAWLRLAWDAPQTVNRIWLFDRPSSKVQVTRAELRFSDGSTITTQQLPDDSRRGRQVDFLPKTIRWLEVRIAETRTTHPFIGLSEIAVFRPSRTATR